jgi:hypothetical protein
MIVWGMMRRSDFSGGGECRIIFFDIGQNFSIFFVTGEIYIEKKGIYLKKKKKVIIS